VFAGTGVILYITADRLSCNVVVKMFDLNIKWNGFCLGVGVGEGADIVKPPTSEFMNIHSVFLDLLICSFNGCFKGMCVTLNGKNKFFLCWLYLSKLTSY
jgi:hypothetical protein